MSDKNTKKNDMFEAMKKAIEEGKMRFPPTDNFMLFMNPKDVHRYKRDFVPPAKKDDIVYGIDPGIDINGYDQVPEGKVWKISKKAFLFPEFKRDESIEKEIAEHFNSIWQPRFSGFRWPSWAAKATKKINPNWSEEWDAWRNNGIYQWAWLNRVGNWINKQVARFKG